MDIDQLDDPGYQGLGAGGKSDVYCDPVFEPLIRDEYYHGDYGVQHISILSAAGMIFAA